MLISVNIGEEPLKKLIPPPLELALLLIIFMLVNVGIELLREVFKKQIPPPE